MRESSDHFLFPFLSFLENHRDQESHEMVTRWRYVVVVRGTGQRLLREGDNVKK